ncbi:MAG: tryptophan--tRNA ligase [Candidatus Vogelbacteria bacterium RIFOXYD1_FULL_46_19]|uniref:Tryptophan--tRNA ligase n=1 Tax=Candidatus Vogelbacteria bacterium RIFOXYD1_FULL_46_19 TaxID=1802439 RepID=A0A1G2QFS1_9BACT|nr:MAG: tryptophan--tRNA ligase [Candidatus Vogelbacteria bacterium RIFOXYD1_FULL_46_19]
MPKKILLSGIKPTGRPHIGNFFGAMKQFVDFQDEYESYIFIPDYHALTSVQDREKMASYTLDLAIGLLAIGLDPAKITLFKQSDVPEVTELTWIFNCLTTMPYLMRAHAFKDAEAKNKEINVGVFDYPMLMAADILIQDADIVPVGQDQKQHVEIARDTAEKFNRTFGETFKLPSSFIQPEVSVVPGIDGRKMSKSYNNHIPLFAGDDEVKSLVAKIVTDSKTPDEPKDPATDNVFALHRLFSEDQIEDLTSRYQAGTIGYKESKDILAANIIKFITPLRTKREAIAGDTAHVQAILTEGGKRAREHASCKMADVRQKLGL